MEEFVDKWAGYRGRNGVIYLFIEGPASILDTLIPESVGPRGQVILSPAVFEGDLEVTPAGTRQKTITEFISGPGVSKEESPAIRISLDGTRCVISACYKDGATFRFKRFTEEDAEDWTGLIPTVWGDTVTLRNHAEYLEILSSEAYNPKYGNPES